jgi:hypothetical protein
LNAPNDDADATKHGRPLALALVVLSFLTRIPALLNAAGTNSDAAVVGLQARHIVHGEWSPFLWGSGYQTSADSTWAALFFLAFGKTPLALMLSALALYVALTLLAYYTLAHHMRPSRAFVATLPLVLTTACIHSYALYPPRQLALTLAFAAFFAIDRKYLGIGGLLALLAPTADPYAMVFLPGALLLAVLVVLRERDTLASRARGLGAFFGGVVLGTVALTLLLARPQAQHGVTTLRVGVIRHNFGLLVNTCLPWAIGTKVYKPLHVMDYVAWQMPRAYAVFAYVGAASLLLTLAFSVVALRRATRPVLHLAAVAWLTIALVFGSFLVSVMVMDQFSMRYLAAAVLVLPFAVAPIVARCGGRAAIVLAPYLASALAGGWLAHGDWVHGPLPVLTDRGRGIVEGRVLSALKERNVEAGIADYWASYRLTFLWREAIPIVPYHEAQDRYPPYRATFVAAKRIAYIHDRDRSFEDEKGAIEEVAKGRRIVERFGWEGFDVVVMDR